MVDTHTHRHPPLNSAQVHRLPAFVRVDSTAAGQAWNAGYTSGRNQALAELGTWHRRGLAHGLYWGLAFGACAGAMAGWLVTLAWLST